MCVYLRMYVYIKLCGDQSLIGEFYDHSTITYKQPVGETLKSLIVYSNIMAIVNKE